MMAFAIHRLRAAAKPCIAPLRPFAIHSRSIVTFGKFYTKDHEWLLVDKNGVGTLGITDFAQKALGDVVFVETPIIGDTVSKQDQIGAVESVKAASDIYTPVSGEIINVNEAMTDNPSMINKSPEDEGWFAQIQLSDTEELADLMNERDYEVYCHDAADH